jgi:hypothetical protein
MIGHRAAGSARVGGALSLARLSKGLALLVLGLALAACSKNDNDTATAPENPATFEVSGTVRAEATGSPLAGAQVRVGERPVAVTNAEGRFAVTGVAAATRVLVRVEAAGYATQLQVQAVGADSGRNLAFLLYPEGVSRTVNPTEAVEVLDTNTGARIAAPANAFRRANGGAAPTGNLNIAVTSVDPTSDPTRMPGDYTATEGSNVRTLESFGAVAVDVRDSAGNRYDLVPGTSATLRIPAASRGGELPATVGLYSLDESTGRWTPEGTATLATDGTRRWYEATVTHLSWWNADVPIDTIFVRGCLRTAAGTPAAGRTVTSVGQDYTGTASTTTNGAGDFSVAMKRGGVAALVVSDGPSSVPPQVVGPSSTDIVLSPCLQERPASATAVAPSIVREPRDESVVVGGFAQFSVLADGTGPLRYRWQRNGVDIVGAVSSVLDRFALPEDDGARYRVIVSNAQGSVTSADAVLRVLPAPVLPPVITSNPVAQTVAPGEVARFAVVSSGTGPLRYQWRRNGADIVDATGSSFSFTTALADSGARFSVVVSNSAGTATSAEALLTVRVPPTSTPPSIVAGPVSTSATVGSVARFSVEATGSPTLGYQWRRNGVAIAGETRSTLSVTVTAADNGARYSVQVRNAFGEVISNDAVLSIVTAGTGVRGTLTITGTAGEAGIGEFTPNQELPGSGVTVTGPNCLAGRCTSSITLGAFEVALAGVAVGRTELLTVNISSSSNTPPGPAPGEAPDFFAVSFAVAEGSVPGRGYAAVCLLDLDPACSVSGVTVNTTARTVTFNNLRLFADGNRLSTRWIELNGVLSY